MRLIEKYTKIIINIIRNKERTDIYTADANEKKRS